MSPSEVHRFEISPAYGTLLKTAIGPDVVKELDGNGNTIINMKKGTFYFPSAIPNAARDMRIPVEVELR